MNGYVAYALLGILLPMMGGLGLARALFPVFSGARFAERMAIGALAGPAIASLAMHLVPSQIQGGAWLGVGLLSVTAIVGWLRPAPVRASPAAPYARSSLLTIIATVAVTVCLVQFGLIAHEVLLRPTFPWDAWATWAFKAKAWFLSGGLPEFVGPGDWPPVAMALSPDGIYPVTAAHYPTLIAGFQVYLATWLGHWNEPLLNLPWLLTHVALVLLVYGEGLRILSRADMAILLACLVSSIPLLATHTALAGYMDLWVAATLTAFCICIVRASLQDRRTTAMTIALAAMLACIKVEALVWIGVVLTTLAVRGVLRVSPAHRGWRYVRSGPALMGVAITISLIAAWAGVSVSLPYFGSLSFGLNPEAGRLFAFLLASWNWHLFFVVLGVCLMVDAWTRSKNPLLSSWRSIALSGLAAVAVICLLTQVAGESPDIRNYNRIILQWLPVWSLYVAAVVAAVRMNGEGS